ncbi:hypothetical protein BN1723_011821 [Verticillium longisporum]|uniref:Uncharacterized protein n=1 Tax=Verticillium longisporum TaxID=100787 RepID=A0A0G4LB46_VERLO|nr:hypothetical protein HYQ44_019749 [Verticillium longisporum]CRK19191.1 hypothetical protein BN1723_011821 [Verticillium longisporum]
MGALLYLKQDPIIWQGYQKSDASDARCFDEFARLMVGRNKGQLFTTLREGIQACWSEVYDIVNPFGDR